MFSISAVFKIPRGELDLVDQRALQQTAEALINEIAALK